MFKRLSIFKYSILLLAFCSWNAVSAAPCGDLFFSEYVEGSGSNKCVEIYNPTGSLVDLSADDYRVRIYFNGSSTASGNIALTGTVAAGDVYIVCNTNAVAAFKDEADQTTGSVSFNGNDVVALEKGGTALDVFGEIGNGSTFASNITYVRKPAIQEGDPDGSDTFDASVEWDSNGSDNSSFIGSHTADPCGGGGGSTGCSDLFFSEYVEGSGNNKCVEIYNPTGSLVDLSADDYRVRIYFNGSSSASGNIALTGTVAAGDVYIVCNTSAVAAFQNEADQTTGAVSFNGNDVVALEKGGTALDVFGEIGNGSTFAANVTYVRKSAIQEGDPDGSDAFDASVEWDSNVSDDSSFIGSHMADPCGCSELFFSEYVEGSGNNKCIEIYNPTGSLVDLSADDYRVRIYFNGSSNASGNIALTGTVASGDVYIVCNSGAADAFKDEADQTTGSVSFNGNDVVALEKGGTALDVFGEIGNSSTFASNVTYVRKPTVQEGDPDGSDAFDASVEWDSNGSDDSSFIGSHTSDCIVIACEVSDVTVDNISACDNNNTDNDAADDTFTFDVTVTFSDAPTSGSLDLTGDGSATVDVSSLDSPTSHKFVGVSGTADGGSIEVTATFSEISACKASDNTQMAPDACSSDPCGDLFFSEYIESGGNKCLEIYNPTGSDIDLAAGGYAINVYANGNTNPTNASPVNLTGTVISGGTHVICNPGATTEIFNKANQLSSGISHNGDDAIELVKGSITLDVIGKIGEDPGSKWSNNGVETEDATLRRKANIQEGDKVGTNDFDPSLEWDAYPQNSSDNIGVHVSDCISCDIPVMITGNADFCADQSAGLDAGVYEPLVNVYEWSNGETTQMIDTDVPGNYAVTVTNGAGCQGVGEIKVSALSSFEISADSESITQPNSNDLVIYQVEVCGGKMPYSLDLEVDGEGFAVAEQVPSANAGCLTILVTFAQGVDWVLNINDSADCGPIVIDSEDLIETTYGVLSINTTEVDKESCAGKLDGGFTIEVDGGDNSCSEYTVDVTGPNSYTASETLNTSTLPASISFDDLASGTYSVVVTDCDAQTITQDVYVGRESGRRRGRGNCGGTAGKTSLDNPSINFVELSPNPFSQMAKLEFGFNVSANAVVDIYTLDGRKAANVFTGTIEEGQNYSIDINASNLAAGVYVLQLTTDSGVVHHEKLYIAK